MTSGLSGGAATIGRGGVAIAMSTGLAASVGLPTAAAAGQTAELTPVKASVAADQALTLLSLPTSLSGGDTPVAAPATASLSFAGGTGTFTAVPKPKPKPQPVVSADRTATKSSRSSTRTASSGTDTSPPAQDASGSSILAVAARYDGVPYVYGGEDPSGFDCSGYVQYVFKKVGISLPRTANQQYNAVTHISSSNLQLGDLVFFVSGGSAYHVGIYAGGGMMWDAPKPGGVVSKRDIWSANLVYGRP